MSRWLAVAGVGVVALAVWFILGRGGPFNASNVDTPSLIYLLLVAVLFLGAAAGAGRFSKRHGAGGPGAVSSLLIWLGLIALVLLVYSGGQFWQAMATFIR